MDTLAVAFLLVLTATGLGTGLAPSMTPWVQVTMLVHRSVGVALLIFVVVFHPVHLLTASQLGGRERRGLLWRIGTVACTLAIYATVYEVWGFDPETLATIPIVAVFLVALMWRSPPTQRRILELQFVVFAVIMDGIIDHLGRILIISLFLHAVWQIVRLLYQLVRKEPGATDPVSHATHYALMCMALFSFVIFEGTGPSGPNRAVYFRHGLHLATTFLFLAILGVHLVRMLARLRAQRTVAPLLHTYTLWISLASFVAVGATYGAAQVKWAAAKPDVRGAARFKPTAYSNLRGYQKTARGQPYDDVAHGCGGTRDCHDDVDAQHGISAHGRAFVDTKFQKQLKIFIGEKGRAAADYCLSCHAPLGVIEHPGDGSRGAVLDPLTTRDPTFTQGIGCIACHRAQPEKEEKKLGNASLTILPMWLDSEQYLGEDNPDASEVYWDMIALAVQLHSRKYHVPRDDWQYVCAACHVVDLPASLADDGQQRRVADQWSSFAKSPYGKAGLRCADCHQQWMSTYAFGNVTVAHNFLGSGTSLPYADVAADRTLRARSHGFLQGQGDVSLEAHTLDELPPCVADLRDGATPSGTALRVRGQSNAYAGTNGGTARRDILGLGLTVLAADTHSVQLRTVTTNACSGHSFPSGGGIKGYLTVSVFDASGIQIGQYGGLGPDGKPLDLPTNLGTRALNAQGEVVSDRRFWTAHKLLSRRVIAPGETLTDNVTIPLAGQRAPKRVEARWNYARPERLRALEDGPPSAAPPVEVIGRASLKL